MKKLILIAFALSAFISRSQTTLLTSAPGAANYAGQVAMNNNIVALYNSLNGATITFSGTSVTSSGTLSAGARAITFIPSSNFVGTVTNNSITLSPSAILTLPAITNNTYNAVPYSISAGTLTILQAK